MEKMIANYLKKWYRYILKFYRAALIKQTEDKPMVHKRLSVLLYSETQLKKNIHLPSSMIMD